jgi:TolA-binding protein
VIRTPAAVVPLLALLASAACATPIGGSSAGAADSAEIRDQLFKLQKDSARVLGALERLESESGEDGAQAVCAEAASRLDEMRQRLGALEEQSLATQQRLDQAIAELREIRRAGYLNAYAQQRPGAGQPNAWESPEPVEELPDEGSPGSGPETGPPVATAPGGAQPEDLFNAAYADYSRGKYELALAGFDAARKADPQGKLADDSLYWLGETLYAMGRHIDAARTFEQVLVEYPSSERGIAARLKKGLALFEARRTTEGVSELQYVIDTWPDSDEARIAREYFRRKGIVEN